MSHSPLLERSAPPGKMIVPVPLSRSHFIGLTLLMILGILLMGLFLKLMDDEINRHFKEAYRAVRIDAAWY